MKPTLDSINAALQGAQTLEGAGHEASVNLYAARELFQSDVTRRSVELLRRARADLISIRRTQTAVLENIDAAISSATNEGTIV